MKEFIRKHESRLHGVLSCFDHMLFRGYLYAFPLSAMARLRFAAKGTRPALDIFWYEGGMKPPTPEEYEGNKLPIEGMMYVGDKGKILAGFNTDSPRIIPESKMEEFRKTRNIPAPGPINNAMAGVMGSASEIAAARARAREQQAATAAMAKAPGQGRGQAPGQGQRGRGGPGRTNALVESLRPGIKTLFVSGYPQDATVRHGVLDAKIAFLPKPLGGDTLARKVREALDTGP